MSAARLRQVLLIGCFLPWCWLAMMVVHECGHVLAAWLTGATVERVVLHPLALSQTDLGENPQPLLVSWAGPWIGCALPCLAWLVVKMPSFAVTPFARFFAGFCLVANGVYLGMGAWIGDGDAGDLLRTGAQVWQLVLFGIGAAAGGFWMWHGQGRTFGFKGTHEQITKRSVITVASVLIITVTLEALLSPL
ncbi:MAG TPA: M50 family metallopeptidase [Planctomycetota bacterium]|nr:M50 family metallopeptidase [Planctomycetota bacterium]